MLDILHEDMQDLFLVVNVLIVGHALVIVE
jgi:hypothetical protein